MAQVTAFRFAGIVAIEQCINGARMTTSGFDSNGDLVVDAPNDPAAVSAIQQALADLGYAIGVDGDYTAATAAVVRQFKIDQALPLPAGMAAHDGVTGPGTTRRLNEIFDFEPPPMPEGESSVTVGFLVPGEDDRIPGEVLFILDPQRNAGIAPNVPAGPIRLASNVPTTTGDPTLDSALAPFGVAAIVRVFGDVSGVPEAPQELLDDLAGTYKVRLDPSSNLDDVIAALEGVVKHAEPNRFIELVRSPDDPRYVSREQWGLRRINAEAAWDRTVGSDSVTVAVVDTGVDLQHPELVPRLTPGKDLMDGIAPGSVAPGFALAGDVGTVDDDPMDEHGHGTSVAGIIAATTNDGVGVAGVTWAGKIMPIRVFCRAESLTTDEVRAIAGVDASSAGIVFAATHGAKVINLSFGAKGPQSRIESLALSLAALSGALCVAGMGNEGVRTTDSFPACDPTVLGVGGIDATGRRIFNFGPFLGVVAPAAKVLTTELSHGPFARPQALVVHDGTSMATPFAAGVAALICAAKPGLNGSAVAGAIMAGAKARTTAGSPDVPNEEFGWGELDARGALDQALLHSLARAAPSPA